MTARLRLAWFSAASITSIGGKGSPREGREELVGSYLYQVHLHHELEIPQLRPLLSGNDAYIKVKRMVYLLDR
jgi:hypothetical protein